MHWDELSNLTLPSSSSSLRIEEGGGFGEGERGSGCSILIPRLCQLD